MDTNEKYNAWHASLEVDYNAESPWHIFFREEQGRFDFSGKRILEIGCGRGGFAEYFMRSYGAVIHSYEGMDFSSEAVKKGKEFVGDRFGNLRLQVGDIQAISFPDNTFDVVFSFETIEHVPDPAKAVRELFRVLKPGGYLLLTTPNYFGFFGLYRIYLRMVGRRWSEAGQPLNQFVMMPKTIRWLKKAGFDVIKAESDIISCPSPFSNRVVHFNWRKPRWIFKWFGLQSFFIARKAE